VKFLLDENVDKRLERFLKKQSIDAISKEKGPSNGKLAEFSKKEKRVFVTNDEDFIELSRQEIFSLIWLKIPQHKINSLISSFSNLIKENKNFDGKLIVLHEDRFEISDLPFHKEF
jgi:predicted nuclease of predicted toxin-antitoxin system